jgi:hypothetical protein
MIALINFPRKTVLIKQDFSNSEYWKNRYLCLFSCLFRGLQIVVNGKFIPIENLIPELLNDVKIDDVESQYSARLLTDFKTVRNPFAPKNPFQKS